MLLVSSSCASRLVRHTGPSRPFVSIIFPSAAAASLRCFPLCRPRGAAAVRTPARHFGNAPSRVRPVETSPEHMWRQSERETSASVIVVIMIIVPLWLFALSAESQERKRDALRAWALAQRASHQPTGAAEEKV
ncbi:putative mitochondrial hypothetical protein [Leptomonas pyrrhocoris]|uniref:Transmembrane protein n=1 Tax=Leptomonas pyrrhocoris TaxID=157538 RepID=A0A0N0DYK8_LEPPY|nr:putative mitochondrial hypothetical protein [Leptomonas pyrrhocoris]XP_015662562.1 putative mitochondrial hypothetical protein [Leptomonas pyrrhocoris]KPA84122.1 putative mitochondrial hypothetical protein [Leptomonas pyrrhocoris]KPA84123.1 putative mitochondrial hypothetical protein [Leptomonas pyrrhocoris]|eukprot:XP_015662561.1 putative mitochondrial hypothetical protein [Leptomonas pyrrhocoris]